MSELAMGPAASLSSAVMMSAAGATRVMNDFWRSEMGLRIRIFGAAIMIFLLSVKSVLAI